MEICTKSFNGMLNPLKIHDASHFEERSSRGLHNLFRPYVSWFVAAYVLEVGLEIGVEEQLEVG